MFARYQIVTFGFFNRLRFLCTGRLWLRIVYDPNGAPTHAAAGFKEPGDAVRATPEELQSVQQQFENHQAAATEHGIDSQSAVNEAKGNAEE